VHKFLRCVFIFFVLPQYEIGLLTDFFISSDGEMHPTTSPSLKVVEVPDDPKGADSNEEEAGAFDEKAGGFDDEEGELSGEEEVAKDIDLGRRGENVDSIEGEKIVEMPDLWDNLSSVKKSEGSGLEHIPIMQEELSMIDSMSPIDYYNFGITIK
jgi:hypothetical protein